MNRPDPPSEKGGVRFDGLRGASRRGPGNCVLSGRARRGRRLAPRPLFLSVPFLKKLPPACAGNARRGAPRPAAPPVRECKGKEVFPFPPNFFLGFFWQTAESRAGRAFRTDILFRDASGRKGRRKKKKAKNGLLSSNTHKQTLYSWLADSVPIDFSCEIHYCG